MCLQYVPEYTRLLYIPCNRQYLHVIPTNCIYGNKHTLHHFVVHCPMCFGFISPSSSRIHSQAKSYGDVNTYHHQKYSINRCWKLQPNTNISINICVLINWYNNIWFQFPACIFDDDVYLFHHKFLCDWRLPEDSQIKSKHVQKVAVESAVDHGNGTRWGNPTIRCMWFVTNLFQLVIQLCLCL